MAADEEEDEMERFDMTGADWKYSMDPLAQRNRMSKKQAWAGVFASDSEDSGEEGRRGFGAGRKRRGGATGGGAISFVSGGVNGGQRRMEAEDLESRDEGNGAVGGDGGAITDESDEEMMNVRLIEERQAGRRTKPKPQEPQASAASRQRQAQAEADFGQWERYTRGIGTKLLCQMGFKHGKGLGKEGQGIVTPVQAVRRKGKEAVGFYKEEVAAAPRRGNEETQAEAAAAASTAAAAARYKRNGQGQQQQQPPRYAAKSREEIVREAAKKAPAGVPVYESDVRVKVIDMTGPEQRVYDGYSALSRSSAAAVDDDSPGPAAAPSDGKRRFDCPALLHNLERLADAAEAEIVRTDRQQREDRDRLAGLQAESQRLGRGRRVTQLADLDGLVRLMDAYEAAGGGSAPLAETCALARRFLSAAPSEYRPVAVAMVTPAARRALDGWQPLLEPARGAACARAVRDALAPSGEAADAVLRDALTPQVRRALSQWSPRQPAEALALVHALRGLAPGLEDLLSTVVAPALQRELQQWDPTRDPQPVHEWLQPWAVELPLDSMHEQVLQKLGHCFGQWHPSDLSARAVLAPWRGAVRPQLLAAFLQRHVLPKLTDCLSDMPVDPSGQPLAQWAWCKAWWDLLNPQQIGAMLERGFFPNFQRALAAWLATPGADFSQVAAWYGGWKEQLSPACLDLPGVQHQLGQALRMMDAALSGQDPVSAGSAAISGDAASSLPRAPPAPAQPATVVNYNHGLGSARDLLERRAEEHGLLFAPTGRRHHGKQIFSFGRLQISVERGLVFQLCDSRWDPVSLTDLMDRALRGGV